ncbi:MAG: M14 metallopeptidase family protein, partial [Candidatus Aminicenantales bacterium]
MKRTKALGLGLILILLASFLLAKVPRPQEFLGFEVGADRNLADMHQIIEYFRFLDGTKGRVKVEEVGLTTMGNPFLVAVITSPENQKKLEKYRRYQQLLADPRRITDKEAAKIIKEGKTVVMINCSIHASEIGASQMSMKLAYELATSEDRKIREILNNVILLLVPMHNPDGIQMVVDWYKKNLGTKYEGGRMPWLYNKYVGHDNNRDWYMLTQVESRLTIKVHNGWHPQIILDMHQMGSRGPRMFVPPYVDPFEPNIDPILEQEVAMMGTFIATELTAQGKAGVIHSSIFDAWTPARAYHHYHGGIRILTEVARAKIATPIKVKLEELPEALRKSSVKMPLPWPGGQWRLKDIVEYDYAAAMAVLSNAARLRECWLQNFYRIHKKAVFRSKPPYAFLIPSAQKNLVAAVKMMKVLKLGGVEIQRAEESFMADGCQYPAGTFIIYLAQPYGGYAKALLERQRYPEIREYPGGPLKRPYDVVAHNLPLLMGVEIRKIEKPFRVKSELLTKIEKPLGRVEEIDHAFGYLWGYTSNDDMVALNRLVKKGFRAFWAAEEFKIAGQQYPAGTMIVVNKEGLRDELKSLTRSL